MVEVGKWIFLGLLLGFCVQWALDTAALERLKKQLPDPDESDDLRRQLQVLQSNLDLAKYQTAELDLARAELQNLKAQIKELESRPATTAPTDAHIPEPETQPTQGLEEIDGLTPDQISLLYDAGILTPADLAAKTPDELLTALDAQPWDMIDPQPWIDQATQLTGTTPPQTSEPAQPSDDLTEIEGITPEFADKLNANGITTFQGLTTKTPDELLEAVDAQPWDMVDTGAWITSAKEKA